VSGDFYAESQYAGTIEIGKATPLGLQARSANDVSQNNTQRVGDIEVTSNFDSDELSTLGFSSAEMTIHAAE
jgi:hypothetical protein